MTVPPNRSGDRLIRDYLAQVTEASLHYLPKGDRAAFLGRARARIESEVGEAGWNDPARIRAVLDAMGDPEELVLGERARIDPGWAARQAGRAPAGRASRGRVRPSVSAPREHRRLRSRWQPAAANQPPRRPSPQSASRPPGSQPNGRQPAEPGGQPGSRPSAYVPGAAEPPRPAGWPGFRRRIRYLAGRHPLETAAVVLLGFGGVISPILPPAWLLGSLLAVPSRVWDRRDKWVAVVGPAAVAAVLTAIIGAIVGGHGNVPEIYGHTFRADLGYVFRAGCVVCAAYLAWRVHKGRRVKVPPWRR